MATAVDTFDAIAARAQESGVDLDARLAGALRLVERLTDPRVERSLARLIDAAPLLERMMEMAEQAPGMLAALVDTADGLQDRMRDAGVDLDARGRTVIRVLERLTAPEALRAVETLLGRVDAIEAVLGSGVLDPRALAAVATAGDALAKAANAPPSRVGLWGAMRAAKDPEIQTALAFMVRFAHAFGADLHEPPTERRLVAGTVR
ncbi:MAG: DUF1641 domain-containing protein [Byssovorax sp.]